VCESWFNRAVDTDYSSGGMTYVYARCDCGPPSRVGKISVVLNPSGTISLRCGAQKWLWGSVFGELSPILICQCLLCRLH